MNIIKDGFLGYRTSFMLDFVVTALVILVPLLLISLWQVRVGKKYETHRKLQLLLGVVLLVAVGAFEIDLQLVHGGWENIVAKQDLSEELLARRIQEARPWLWVHLVFAVSTPVLWAITIALALRRFPRPASPAAHSKLHARLGWISSVDLALTAVTGLLFYYVAFMQS